MSFHLLLPQAIYEQMIQHAQAELPNECCGLLAAVAGEPGSSPQSHRIERCYPLINAKASAVEYESESESLIAAHIDMRQNGLELVAIYHSHPSSPPIPSRTDIARNNYGESAVNFIISLQKKEPQVRAWWLTATDYREATWELVD